MRVGPLNIGRASKAVILIFILPVVMLFLLISTGVQIGLVGYLFLTVAVAIWNAAVLLYTMKKAGGRWWMYLSAAGMMMTVICWTALHPVIFRYSRSVLLFTYLIALAWTAFVAYRTKERRLRHYAAPLYNFFLLMNMVVWVSLDAGDSPPTFLHVFGFASGLSQAVNFYWVATFMPMLFFPPVLLRLEHDERIVLSPQRRINMQTVFWGIGKFVSAATAYLLGFMILCSVVGVANISSYGKADDDFTVRPTMQFAIVARAFTAEPKPVKGWSEGVDKEIAAAKDLGLNYLRYDIRSEMIESAEGFSALQNVSSRVHNAGLQLMLGLYGKNAWPSPPPRDFDEYKEQIINDTMNVANIADYVLPFYEPNGQAQINYGHYEEPEVWASAVKEVTDAVHANRTAKVLIEVGDNKEAMKLIPTLCAQGIDAIGFDIYPGNKADLKRLEDYNALVNRSSGIEVWFSEFGMECSMYGEQTQANLVNDVMALASRLNVTGCCLWCLEDDTGLAHGPMVVSHLGIVRSDWSPKPGYDAYKESIARIRG